MKGLLRGFDALVQQREDGRVLAFLRMSFGFLCAWIIIGMLVHGVVDSVWLGSGAGGLTPVRRGMWLTRELPLTPTTVRLLVAVCLGSSLLFAAGLGAWFFGVVTAVSFYALRSLNPPVTGGYDALLLNVFLFLIVSDCTRTWSLDCWLRKRRWRSDELVAAWPRHLVTFQLVILYVATGLKKASIVWTPTGGYYALFYVYMDPTWRRMESVDFMHWAMPVLRFGTALTWHWEHFAFVLLILGWFRFTRERDGLVHRLVNRWDLRWPWLAVGFAMHVGVWLTTNVGPFSSITLAMYPALFGPVELEKVGVRLKEWLRRPRSESSDVRSQSAAGS
ncbi:MAG: HTTM domain-containing protein [Myxococcota bacterium]